MIVHLEQLLGAKAKIELHLFNIADMTVNQADISKAQHLLGCQPQVSLKQGVQQLCVWYLAEREWASQVVTD